MWYTIASDRIKHRFDPFKFQGVPGIAGPKGFMGLCGCDGDKVTLSIQLE